MSTKNLKTFFTLFIILIFLGIVIPCKGIVPLDEAKVKELKEKGKLKEIIKITQDFREKRADIERKLKQLEKFQAEQSSIGTGSFVVLLCEFSDNLADQTAHGHDFYERLFFSKNELSTGSFREYYNENSYGKFDVEGDTSPWYMMPQTYSYYVNGKYGFSDYPQNAEKMVEDVILMADADIDFSQFDNDGPDGIPNSGDDDGYIDAIFVLHAGPEGAGYGGSAIWSHASYLWHNRPEVDGVRALRYTVCPEASSIGVYAHEYGHTLGLPDLYDTDYSSDGLGKWSMMAAGTHQNNGRTPTQFDAWSKVALGWINPVVICENSLQVYIPQVETNETVFLLWTDGIYSNEYFLVENRQRTLFDTYLPGDGILIYHVDENIGSNQDENHPLVHLEQADGRNDLAKQTYYRGDNGDPYPGSTKNRYFNESSNPDSRDYNANITHVRVENISDSSSNMKADLFVNQPLKIDSKRYNCASVIFIEVLNSRLQGQGNLHVSAVSATESAAEKITVNEDSETPGLFKAKIQLEKAEPIADGKLQINDGDNVTISYLDPVDEISYQQTAFVDCLPPSLQIFNTIFPNPYSVKFIIYSSENSYASIEYGTTKELDNSASSAEEPSLTNEIRIENLTPCTIYYYVIKLTDDVGNEETYYNNGEPFTFETHMDKAVGLAHLTNDFEGSDPKLWNHAAAADKVDEWELGLPEDGPQSTHSGDNCWGIDLDSSYDAGNDSWLVTPEIDLTESFNPHLSFWHWYEIWVDDNSGDDGAWVEVSIDGTNWTHITPDGGYPQFLDPDAPYNPSRETEDLIGVYAGKTENWEKAAFSLKDFRGHKIQIRFHFWQDSSDNKGLLAGWYIDDVRIFDDNYGICHRGDLQFLSDSPNCSFPLTVYLSDNDLNLNPEVIDTYYLSVVISSNPTQIQLALHESEIDTGVFFGTLVFSNEGLQVSQSDQISTEYVDENPGTGGMKLNLINTTISCVTTSANNFGARDVPNDNGGVVELYWEPSQDDGRNENDISMYILYRADAGISSLPNFEQIQQIQNGTRTTRDTNATPPKDYFYLLETVDLYGNTARTQNVGPVTGTDNISPEPPSNLRVNDLGKGDSILLEWDHQKTEQGDGYLILYDTKSGWPYKGKGSNLGDSPIQVGLTNSVVLSGLQADREYFFTVRATEYTGARSLMSNEVSGKPTSVDLPMILAAGFDDSFVEYGGEVYVQALVQRGSNPIDKVKVFYKGNDTGLELNELWNQDSTAFYGGTVVVTPTGEYKNKIFVELYAIDDRSYGSVMWPYLDIPGTQGNDELPDRAQFSWREDFEGSQSDLNNAPKITLGGYWDTKFNPGNVINTLKMKVLVTHPDVLNSIDSVAFIYGNQISDFKFNDSGINGDGQGGDGIYSFQLDLADYPQSGYYILTVVAKDLYGNMSNIFPYIHIVK